MRTKDIIIGEVYFRLNEIVIVEDIIKGIPTTQRNMQSGIFTGYKSAHPYILLTNGKKVRATSLEEIKSKKENK